MISELNLLALCHLPFSIYYKSSKVKRGPGDFFSAAITCNFQLCNGNKSMINNLHPASLICIVSSTYKSFLRVWKSLWNLQQAFSSWCYHGKYIKNPGALLMVKEAAFKILLCYTQPLWEKGKKWQDHKPKASWLERHFVFFLRQPTWTSSSQVFLTLKLV